MKTWSELTSRGAAEAGARDAVVVLPLAAVEQHGPHLPLSTDVEITRGLLTEAFRKLPDDTPVYALPIQEVGASDEHADHAGTLSLGADVLEEAIVAIGSSVADAGIRRLVLFNGHGGNRPTLDVAGLRLRRDQDMLVVKANYYRFPRPDSVVLPASEWTHGLHGGAVETSMMLHLRPDLVRRDEIARFTSLGEELADELEVVGPEGAASFSWLAGDLNPEGVTGDAGLASAEIGRQLVDHYASCLSAVLRDALAFPIDRLAETES